MLRFNKLYMPESIEEVIKLKAEYGTACRIIAGGTDVVPQTKLRPNKPEALISLQKVEGLSEITVTDEGLTLGAYANLREISLKEELTEKYLVVKEAAGHVSSMQVRNMATIGGNACNASPSADAIHGPLLNDAVLTIVGAEGERTLAMKDFFKGPGKVDLQGGEILKSFFIPAPKANTGCSYKKFAIRGDSDISIVGAGARITLAEDGTIAEARITLAAVAPVPLRCEKGEAMLVGKKPSEELFAEVAEFVSQNEATPIKDQRASKEYRVEMVKVWTRHALLEACERASK